MKELVKLTKLTQSDYAKIIVRDTFEQLIGAGMVGILDRGEKTDDVPVIIYCYKPAKDDWDMYALSEDVMNWTAGDKIEDDPTEEPTEAPTAAPVAAVWDYIWNEETWNAAYNKENSALKAYLDANPDEDRWNEHENRWAYEADKVDGEWPEWCVQCWKGAISAPGAKYPWCVVNLEKPFDGTIRFKYDDGEPVYPWGADYRRFNNGYGIASIPAELGMEYILDEEGHTTFDPEKLEVLLFPGQPATEE